MKQLEKLQQDYLKKSSVDSTTTSSDDSTECDDMLSSLKSQAAEANVSELMPTMERRPEQ